MRYAAWGMTAQDILHSADTTQQAKGVQLMSTDLLESLTGLLTPDLIGKAASTLGDSEAAVSKGMSAAFPLLLGGLAQRASEPSFASTLFDLVRDPRNDGSLLGNVSSLLAPGASSSPMMAMGGKLLGSLFGNNLGNLGNALGSYAGVRPASATSMLNFAAPLVLSMLGKAVKSGNLNLSSLVGLLTGNKDKYMAAVPGPLSRLESYFASPAAPSHAAPPPAPKSSIWRWLLPLLIVLGLLFMLSRCMGSREKAVEMAPAPTPAPAVEPAPLPAPEPVPVAAPSADVFFDVGVSELPADTDATLATVIGYLQANPGSMAVLSGYHDPTGNKEFNEELAKSRAAAVRDVLMAAGIDESRIEMAKPIETTGSGSLEDARRVEVAVR